MPLDTSTYTLSLLRLDGRRWNELRRLHAQISTQAAADGSSYLEMGNTKVLCTVRGPIEAVARQAGGEAATIDVEVVPAGFSGTERRRKVRLDKRLTELSHALRSAYGSIVHTHLYPNSTIHLHIHILSQDGSLLAACINAATLALIDAGVPMTDYLVACTAASAAIHSAHGEAAVNDASDPLLDLNALEEQELPFVTVATLGKGQRVSIAIMETRVRVERLEGMLAVAVDGCKRVRDLLDAVVKRYGKRFQ